MLLVGAFILPSQGESGQSCLDSRPNIRPTNNSDAVLDGDGRMHPVHNKIGGGPRNLVNRKEHATERKKIQIRRWFGATDGRGGSCVAQFGLPIRHKAVGAATSSVGDRRRIEKEKNQRPGGQKCC